VFESILVPLDGSTHAEAALPFAKAIAARTAARLILVRTAQNPSPLGDVTYQQQHHTLERAVDYLALMSDDLIAQGFDVKTGVPYAGSAAEWIVEESQFRKADLIVMATHDRVGPDRWVHGSVAEGVVHTSSAPVLLVRSHAAEQRAQRFNAAQPVLIVPLDGSDLAEAALPLARAMAHTLHARVILVGVVPRAGQLVAGQVGAIVTYVGADLDALEAEAKAYLEASAARVGVMPGVEAVVRYGDPAAEIAALAEEHAAAAVVMATHGRTGLVRAMLGSVAGGVLHHSKTPVLLIRPAVLRPAEQPIQSAVAVPLTG